jgi:C-terminal processing protease CtpA/Prc
VTIPGARPSLAKQRINASNFIQSWGISSTGKRAVAQARGDVWTLPAENGSPRNLTRTDGIAERTPSWSPDGRWIAYFSDETGEYELYVTQSDGKGETKQLTNDSKTFYQNIMWSPDSEHILYTDNAHNLFMYTLESGESRHIYKDPYGDAPQPSWSHDSSWIAYAKTDGDQPVSAIWLYHVEDGQHHKVTEGFFDDSSPAFDRKGDYLYFTSTRRFSPTYSDVDTSFIYDDSQVLIAVPLREDVESPWLLESDEETWKEDKPKEEDTDEKKSDEDAEDGDEKAGDDANGEGENDADDADDDANDDGDDEDATANPIVGDWEGTISGLTAMGAPEEMDSIPFTMTITENADGTLSGTSEAMGESDEFDEVTFDRSTNEFYARSVEEGFTSIMKGLLSDDSLEGSWEIVEMSVSGTWEASKIESEQDDEASEDNDEDDGDEEAEKDEKEQLKIDLENFESRAMMLPVGSGNFRNLAVNNRNHLLYVRIGKGVMSFDLSSGKKNEKTVAPGAFGFAISGDGKKILVPRGRAAMIQSSGGGSGDRVVTDNMTVRIDPRKEWEQLLVDAWRIHREFFYVENMHGVDWPAVLEQYRAMLDDCVTREDVSYLIREMIGELNVGHAYYFGGDTEGEPRINVGMLGVDWGYDDENDAYRIKKIHHGAPWDVDARSPFHPIGVDVKEGDYLLAVNGVEVDTSVDPWAPFIGTAGKTITMTVNDTPEMNDEARTVVIKPIGGEGRLRYRSWIEHNRQYVDEKTDGKIGYIYVPDTGVNGQNDLVRQYFGQIKKEGLIIDERWNGGGQIPTRFIEMLNRPVTNYWKRRDSKDWVWPPDAHHGPKCMLINGRAGSGGDMFPWLFRYNNLGKLIGTRTWGGLVGISGNPPLIDNGYTSVPTFGFYEKDGTWGIEGHGVDPDIRVVDDPSKMVDGGDPQLDAAIEHMLEQIEKNPYTRPDAPKPPDRSGMGIEEEDK